MAHVDVALEGIGEARVFEHGATREVIVDGTVRTYRIRVKRHDVAGRVSTYPTQGALEFLDQPPLQQTFEGLGQAHLIVGYQWEADTHEIGPAVLSLREGKDNIIWLTELEESVPPSPTEKLGDPRSRERPRIELMSDDADMPAAGE